MKGDTWVLLQPAQWSPAGREDHFFQKVFVCVGGGVRLVREGAFELYSCKVGELDIRLCALHTAHVGTR